LVVKGAAAAVVVVVGGGFCLLGNGGGGGEVGVAAVCGGPAGFPTVAAEEAARISAAVVAAACGATAAATFGGDGDSGALLGGEDDDGAGDMLECPASATPERGMPLAEPWEMARCRCNRGASSDIRRGGGSGGGEVGRSRLASSRLTLRPTAGCGEPTVGLVWRTFVGGELGWDSEAGKTMGLDLAGAGPVISMAAEVAAGETNKKGVLGER
jgi:hypothetical protein